MSGKDKVDLTKTGEAADAHKGLFCWLFTCALSVSTRVMYGPKPPLSERCQERGNEEQSDQKGTATTIEPLSQCQRWSFCSQECSAFRHHRLSKVVVTEAGCKHVLPERCCVFC